MNVNLYALKWSLAAALLCTLLLPDNAEGQQLGIANSNYAGTNSLYTNPSAIADSRHKFFMNLFSTEFGATNNYLRYDAPVSLFKLIKNDMAFESEYIKENLNGKPKLVMAGAEFRGPSVMVQLNSRQSFAFTTRVKGAVQANNLSEEVARLYKVADGEDESYLNKAYSNNAINLNANVYSEFGLTYARVILEKGQHFVKAGATVKRLSGGYSAHLNIQNTDFSVEERELANGEEFEYIASIDKIKAQYGYASMREFDAMESGDVLRLLTGSNSVGSGWGADLGLTYEYRPDASRYNISRNGTTVQDAESNKYKYRVGIALMDMGGINYDDAELVRAYNIERANKELNLSELGDAEDTEKMLDYLSQSLDVSEAEKNTKLRAGLPTALHLNFDYQVKGAFYANATLIQGLRGKQAIGMRQNSLLAISPRVEFKKFEASMPIALQNNYSVLTVGAMIRFLHFYVGSDNIGGAFNIGNPYGANAYVGVSLLPLLKRNPKEKKPATTSSAATAQAYTL